MADSAGAGQGKARNNRRGRRKKLAQKEPPAAASGSPPAPQTPAPPPAAPPAPPGLTELDENKVMVENLAYSLTDEGVKSVASEHGTVLAVHYPKQEGGTGKGFAFVEYSSAQEAQAAITGLQGHQLMGRPLRTKPYEKRDLALANGSPQQPPAQPRPSTGPPPGVVACKFGAKCDGRNGCFNAQWHPPLEAVSCADYRSSLP